MTTTGQEPLRPHRWRRRLAVFGGGLVLLTVAVATAFVLLTRNPEPGAFYTPPDDLSGPPGTILRAEPFDDGIPAGARAWKVLYLSSDEHDRPLAVSGLVIAPLDPPPGPRPVLAWAHGTTGIARPCAPSLARAPLDGIPDLTGPLAQGWVITLTDYPGLGTPSPHPYLVGASEGRAVLDSVRAAHLLDTGLELDDRYAIWGHSQGGHAALFAGGLAADHLPGHELVGVAALAPATRLLDTLAAVGDTIAGRLLTIFAVESWSAYYDDIPEATLTDRARRPAERLARACLNQPSRFRIVVVGLTLSSTILALDPTTDPAWTARLEENTPGPSGVTVPLFVGQGLADDLIVPEITEHWASARCDAGGPTSWRAYRDVDHIDVVGPGGADALAWTIDRFAGIVPADECPSR